MGDKHDIFSSSPKGNEEESNLPELRQKKIKEFKLEIDPTLLEQDPDPVSSPSTHSQELLEEGKEISSHSGQAAEGYEKYHSDPPSAAGQKGKKKKKKKQKKNGCLYSMIYVVVICFSVLILSQFLIRGAYDLLGVNRSEEEITVEITPETELDDVVNQLSESGAINEPFFFRLYAKLTDAVFSPGKYTIPSDLDYEALINALNINSNRMDTVKLMFPEGSTVESIAQQLEDSNVCSKEEFLEEVNKIEDFQNYSFVKEIPENEDRIYALEGYLFPDTYEFYCYEKPKTAIRRFLNAYNTRITREMLDRAEEIGMTMDEVLTLASLIEKEAKTEDMAKVSSVFHNRLEHPEQFPNLQSNTTDYYPYTKDTMPEGYSETSKYNTYNIQGMPPGPICNPGLNAIRAALYPADTNYYYFNMDVNGKAYFARTLQEHNKNLQTASQVEKIEEPDGTENPEDADETAETASLVD